MTGSIIIGILGLLCLFVLLAMRMQIGFAMAVIGFAGFWILSSYNAGFSILGMEAFKTGSAYSLSVIPLFILMGQFANYSRMGSDIYQMVYRWMGHRPGGLAMATVGACAGFAAISGSSLATAAAMGAVALPEMKKYKYSMAMATGCIAAGGTLGILIPPSTVLIVYGLLTEQSISTLFVAGIIPGILLSLLFITTIYVQTRIHPEIGPPGPKYGFDERLRSLRGTWGLLLLFLVVIGGLYTGWFTPTEAAGVGAFGAFVITFIKRRLSWPTLMAALKETTRTTAMVFGILIGANILQYFLTISQIPDQLSQWVAALGVNRWVVMAILVMVFIVLGCFMEGLSIMILTIPIIYPIVLDLGFNPVWFGIIVTLVMEMSLITPPVGVNVFVLAGVAEDVPMYTVFRGVIPFWTAMLVCIILLMLFPEIALLLPETM